MKVQTKSGKLLAEFEPGTCFYDETGELYIVTEYYDKSTVTCVNLEDGTIWETSNQSVYTPVECEVVVS